ncbi:hypothetical protein [Paenibacillus arenilitoris]|uniref:DUF559 domain-containing protein n=1 Tax=Paenibacillus arenilitoris TaxID=2772299 RepID=A0A927CSZ1_9BACL|nr:hypothetical protein [Paenibacillus arenilitoris]MBD2871316.1 hypothetical protein [Paenibacillus arenilitoris]
MDSFEGMHQLFIEKHLSGRSGERKGRLMRGHRYAEKLWLEQVWWPLLGNFDNLHPEYEVYDWNRKSVFLDFAYITPFGRFGIECDGFQTHVKDMDREKFSYSLNRDTFLTGLGWRMLHFSVDDIKHQPEVCRTLLQLALGPHLIRGVHAGTTSLIEKELLAFAWRLGRPVRSKDVCDEWRLDFRTAQKLLRALTDKGWLRPLAGGKTIRYYELKEDSLRFLL